MIVTDSPLGTTDESDRHDCPGCDATMTWIADTWYCAHCDISIRPPQSPPSAGSPSRMF